MTTSLTDELLSALRGNPAARAAFITAHAKQSLSMQIDDLLRQCGFTQAELARRAGLTQGVVSRAANPEYGNLTINTCIRIAAGFDVAFVGRFVSYSKLFQWIEATEDDVYIPTFDEEFGEPAAVRKKADTERRAMLLLSQERFQRPSDVQRHFDWNPRGTIVVGRIEPKTPSPPLDAQKQATTNPELYGTTDAASQRQQSAGKREQGA